MTTLSAKGQAIALLSAKVGRVRSLTNTLFDDFWASVDYADAIEGEIQYFLDDYRVFSFSLICRNVHFLRNWEVTAFLRVSHAHLSLPLSQLAFLTSDYSGAISYNKVFLALEVSFTVPPPLIKDDPFWI